MKRLSIFNFERATAYPLSRVHIITFLVIFSASFIVLEMVNRYAFVEPKSKDFETLRLLNRLQDQVETIFLGDSHFISALEKIPLDQQTLNLSFGGANYIQSYYLLNRYLKSMRLLKRVILPLDIHSFSSFRTDRIREPYFWNRFIQYGDLVRVKGPAVLLNKLKYFTILDETFGRRQLAANIARLFWDDIGPLRGIYGKKRDETLERVRYYFHGHNGFDEDLALYFRRILELCSKNGIEVITIATPLSRAYVTHASAFISSSEMRDRLFNNPSYAQHISKHLDYERVFFDHDEYFTRDGDHLNSEGSEAFSNMFKKDFGL